uniref:Uncharacterized protein n=1 Tax=Arundo donax TaxID=35708 RepID=A0A0A8Z6P0_ARUDO
MLIKCSIKPPINCIKNLISSIEIPHPLNQFDLVLIFLKHNRPPSTGNLQGKNAKAVYIRFFACFASGDALWSQVTHCTS